MARNMLSDEEVLWKGRPAMFRNSPGVFCFTLILTVVFIIALLLVTRLLPESSHTSKEIAVMGGLILGLGLAPFGLILWYLKCLGTRLTVTNRRTILRRGILAKQTFEIRHKDVRGINVRQGVVQRLLGVGALSIGSAAHAGMEITISGIRHPQKLAALIRQYCEK